MHKRGFQHATPSSKWQFRRLLAAVSLFGASLCLSACPAGDSGDKAAGKGKGSTTGQTGAGAEAPHYVVTVKPLELILGRLCEGRATVSTLLEAGANSHTFDPAPSDVQAIAEAGAFIWVGEAYDGWAAEFENANSVALLSLLPADMLSPLPEHGEWLPHDDHSGPGHAEHSEPSEEAHTETHDHAEADHGHEHSEDDHAHEHAEAEHAHAHGGDGHAHDHGELPDPHFYTDPLLVKALLEPLSQRLAQIDPGGAALYQQNAAAFALQLDALDAALRERMAPCAGAPVLMFHPSFVYFLKRYGLQYAGSIEPFPGKEPTPRDLQKLAEQLKASGARAVFSETLLPAAPAEALAEAISVPVVELDPACGNSGRDYRDYEDWLNYNAGLILDALTPASSAAPAAAAH